MTSKDYIKIAQVLKLSPHRISRSWMARLLAIMLKTDNPRFNPPVFFKAIGLDEKGMEVKP